MSDPITLVVWKVGSEERPTGGRDHMERAVLAVHPDTGVLMSRPAWTVDAREPWWAELPNPPSSDPLTLDDLWLILPAAQDTAARLRDIEHPDANEYKDALDRLRATLVVQP